MTETYYVTEFGVTFWSYGGKFETEKAARDSIPALLKSAQKHNPDNKVRASKVTREVLK